MIVDQSQVYSLLDCGETQPILSNICYRTAPLLYCSSPVVVLQPEHCTITIILVQYCNAICWQLQCDASTRV